MVRELTKNDRIYIVNNLIYTTHSVERIKERLNISKVDNLILESDFSFMFGKDINIQIKDSDNYLVLVRDEENNKFILITTKRKSYSGKTLKEKYEIIKERDKKCLTICFH